jgi:hypothetical protein
MDDYVNAARTLTDQLRNHPGAGWVRLREFLEGQGVDPSKAALAVLWREDVALLFAWVVVSPERMFEIELEYPQDLDESSAMEDSHVVAWNEDVERISGDDFIKGALQFLSQTA